MVLTGCLVVEHVPNGNFFVIGTYVIVELAGEGNEVVEYDLVGSISNIANPLASTLTKNVNSNFDVTNADIVEDSTHVRWEIQWAQVPLNAALDKLKSSREGLTSDEAEKRLAEYGPNKLPEKIGYFEEVQAGDAVSALMGQLAPEANVYRDGEIKNVPADLLVPSDVLRVRLSDVIPADIKFLEGDSIKVDQSSLTGESLPVTKSEGDEGYSGSVVKQGEIEAVVTRTGVSTFLGRAAEKIALADAHGRLQMALTTVSNFCMVSILFWCMVELLARMAGHTLQNPCVIVTDGCLGVANILVLIVGGIPVAMPTVLSVTLAI
ncbi:hypothetical protein PHYBOEH_000955, partial [Phytophthora boehmeriae]